MKIEIAAALCAFQQPGEYAVSLRTYGLFAACPFLACLRFFQSLAVNDGLDSSQHFLKIGTLRRIRDAVIHEEDCDDIPRPLRAYLPAINRRLLFCFLTEFKFEQNIQLHLY